MSITAFTQAQKNIRKTWLLMGGFLVFIILIGWGFSTIFQNPIILYVAVGFSLIMNFASYFFSDKVALKMSGAKKADSKIEEHRRVIRAVENMSLAARIPTPKIYIIEDEAMNAFATGRDPKNASVAITIGLLRNLDKLELEGVMAHEIAHIKNRDILVMTIVVTLVGVIAIMTDLIMRQAIFGRLGGNQGGKAQIIIIIVGVILAILSVMIAKMIQMAISRKREFLADASGAEITRHPAGLAGALRKISAQGQKVKKASTATAHLYFFNPFGKKNEKKGKLSFFKKAFSTHPPVEERISALEKMGI